MKRWMRIRLGYKKQSIQVGSGPQLHFVVSEANVGSYHCEASTPGFPSSISEAAEVQLVKEPLFSKYTEVILIITFTKKLTD